MKVEINNLEIYVAVLAAMMHVFRVETITSIAFYHTRDFP